MSHEAVDPRANVKVLLGTDGENFLSGPQILKKVPVRLQSLPAWSNQATSASDDAAAKGSDLWQPSDIGACRP